MRFTVPCLIGTVTHSISAFSEISASGNAMLSTNKTNMYKACKIVERLLIYSHNYAHTKQCMRHRLCVFCVKYQNNVLS